MPSSNKFRNHLKSLSIAGIVGTSVVLASSAMATQADEPHAGSKHFPISIADAQAKADQRFEKIDVDANGAVDLAEFENAKLPRHLNKRKHRRGKHAAGKMDRGKMGTGKMKDAAATELFAILDQDNSGQIDADEFLQQSRKNKKLAMRRAVFKHLDANGDGNLTAEELPARIKHLREADTDGDGMVSREEIRAAHAARAAR